MPVRVLIVDDDARERIVLRYVLEQIRDIEIVGEAIHGLEALLLCQEKKIDLIFLDIGMPEMGGMETVRKLMRLKEPPLFAFVTVKRDMAVDAFELGALDYIVKPIEQGRIENTIEKAKKHIAHKDIIEAMVQDRAKKRIDIILGKYKNFESFSNKLPVREKGKITILNHEEIIYCESQTKKVVICTEQQSFLTNFTLNELEFRLDKDIFFRAHQAFIVNMNFIREIINFGEGSYLLHLRKSDKNIILSRSRAKQLREKMGIK